MGIEIERKFLVNHALWQLTQIEVSQGELYKQGYMSTDPKRTIRVRRTEQTAYLTIKGQATGASRAEFEYEIPVDEAEEILATICIRPIIEKRRYKLPVAGHTWEVDVFYGENEGLIVAEIELQSEDEAFEMPAWVTTEVTADGRYTNASLVTHPFKQWVSI